MTIKYIFPISYDFKRRFLRQINLTDENSFNQIHTFDMNYSSTTIKETSTFTKTQIKVMITVVLIISLIMFIIVLFRLKNSCRTKENENIQSEILRNRTSQYSEPSSRRGSVGYYTQRYNRTTNNIHLDNQLNLSLPAKRLSIPACDHSSKPTAASIRSTSPGVLTDARHHHHHVTSSCDTSNISNQYLPIDLQAVVYKSSSSIANNQCNEQTPLLISELASTSKDSSIHPTRKYSLNALLPFVRPSISHPFCSSLTSTIARGTDVGNDHGLDLKFPRRFSLSSIQHRTSSSIKKPHTFSPTPRVLSINSDTNNQQADHDQNKSSHITQSKTTSLSSYPKDFMRKIERFRFIDDSASSSTTMTSPIESIESVHTRSTTTTRQLINNTIEQFDDYARENNGKDDEINSLIDELNADSLTDGSYSDLNIFNYQNSSNRKISRPQNFQMVHKRSFQTIVKPIPTDQQLFSRVTFPINIPHSTTSLPVSRQQRFTDINGHSQSMDFQSIGLRRELFTTINETPSSSSSATLTSMRSSTSLEFDDNTKPSGVLVDDDFLPMSSPIDEHFWTMSGKDNYAFNSYESFPNVGSSPDVEVKYIDIQQFNNFSETSCDEDEDIQTVSITHPLEIISQQTTIDPSIDSTEQFLPILSTSEQISSPIHSIAIETTVEDDTQENSHDDVSEGDGSTDNGEIDLIQEFQLSQKEEEEEEEEQMKGDHLWLINDRNVYIIGDDENDATDLISSFVSTPTNTNRSQPTSIMKITQNRSIDSADEQTSPLSQTFKPKVRFNLDPQYEREREWNKVNKLLGNSVEWTDEFEV